MLSDPWRLQPAVPDLIGDGGSTDEEDDYDDTGFDDPYEVARKVREANARLRADSTPLESSRERRVRFRDPIRAVFCFTPDGGEEEEEESSKDEDRPPAGEEDDDQEGDASIADDPAARYGTVRRLVTAAAVERRSSLTSEEPLLPTPAVTGGLGSKDSSEKLLGLGADSDEDIDSFESDNTSVSEDISDLTGDKDDNQDASVQEVSDASEDEDADGDRLESTGADSRVAAESSSSTENDRDAKPRLSWDSSMEEAVSIGVQEEVPSDVSAERVQAKNEDVAIVGGSPVRAPQHKEDPSSAPTSESSPPEGDETLGRLSQTATAVPQSRTTGTRSSTSQGTLASVYGGTPRPRSVGAGGRVNGTPPRAATAGRGRSGFVASEAAQRARRPWTGAAPISAAPSTSRVLSAGSAPRTSEQGPPVHPKQQQKEQPMSARQARSSFADGSKMDTKTPYAVPVGGAATSTYALPRELKEELVRKKRRERELREQREAREERERRQRAQEADQAFKAWLAKKRRQGSLPRSDRSEESSSRSESSRTTDDGERRGAASSSAAFEAWLRRKQRQQREEELRRRLRQLDLEATERPRRSRHEAQQVYLAWLERKCEEERQRRQAAWAERRGGREAALSARSLRLLERYLRSDEFARYPELVV